MPFNGPVRVYFDAASAGALTAANNGLAVSGGNTVQWGGDLIQNTVINGKTFDWSFTADDGGNDRNALAWDQSTSQFSFGEAANNFAVTGTWYLSPTSQAGYLTFTTYDSPDTAIQIGVDANNYSQVRLYNGSTVLGVDIGRIGANTWAVTVGDAVNQSGKVEIYNALAGNPYPIRVRDNAGVTYYRVGSSGTVNGQGFRSYGSFISANGGSVDAPGNTFATLSQTGLFLSNNANAAFGSSDGLRLTSVDLSAGNTMLRLDTEGSGALATGSATNSHTLAIDINGTTYYILLASTR